MRAVTMRRQVLAPRQKPKKIANGVVHASKIGTTMRSYKSSRPIRPISTSATMPTLLRWLARREGYGNGEPPFASLDSCVDVCRDDLSYPHDRSNFPNLAYSYPRPTPRGVSRYP